MATYQMGQKGLGSVYVGWVHLAQVTHPTHSTQSQAGKRQAHNSQVEKRVELALFYLIILTSTSPKSKP